MLGVDGLNKQGLRVPNFADTSGNPPASKVYRAAKLVFSQKGIDATCWRLHGANQEQWHTPRRRQGLREELPSVRVFPSAASGRQQGERILEILREAPRTSKPGSGSTAASASMTRRLAAEMKEMVLEYKKEQKKG